MNQLALIVPTRNRPGNALDLIHALDDRLSSCTNLFLVVDHDDVELEKYSEIADTHAATLCTVTATRRGMAAPLNHVASMLKFDYTYFAFMGDDHRPRTLNWDVHLMEALDELGTGIAYGNDLHQGAGLPTAVAMTGDIVQALDGMVPPNMIHLYLDNFWLKLGQDLDAITYLPDTVIEHCHPIFGTADWDEGYKEVNAPEIYSADGQAFNAYIASPEYAQLLETLRGNK